MSGRYDRAHDGLPWGWWLRATSLGFEDGEGGVWPDVRAAFWEGRLGMNSGHLAGVQQELLLRVLVSLDADRGGSSEHRQDLFGGDVLFWRFHMCWLASVGMTMVDGRGTAFQGRLSQEGRAAMLMLQATRDPAWVDLPMADVVDAVRRSARTAADGAREEALRAFECGVTRLPRVFARERVGRVFLVTLTAIDPRDRMPTLRVVWSASFDDEGSRDDLFGWLAERVHRWDDWGGIAREKGAAALTSHLLSMLVVSPVAAGRRLDDGASGE